MAYSSPPKYFGEAGMAVLQTSTAGRNCTVLLEGSSELNWPSSTFTPPASHQQGLPLPRVPPHPSPVPFRSPLLGSPLVWVLPPGSFSSTPHRSRTWALAEPSSLFGLIPASAAPGDASPEVFARVHSDGGPGFPQASGFALKAATEVLLGQRSLPRAVTFHQTTANQEGEHGQGDTWSSYQQRTWTVHVHPSMHPTVWKSSPAVLELCPTWSGTKIQVQNI